MTTDTLYALEAVRALYERAAQKLNLASNESDAKFWRGQKDGLAEVLDLLEAEN